MFLNSCGKRSGRVAASATRDGTRIRSQELGSCTIRCLSFRWVARRFPARGWVLAEQTRIWIPLGGTAIPRHRLGSRGRLLLAFCRAVTARRKPAHSLFKHYSVEESIFHNAPPSLKDASCDRPEKTWMSQVPPVAQSCTTALCYSYGSLAAVPFVRCILRLFGEKRCSCSGLTRHGPAQRLGSRRKLGLRRGVANRFRLTQGALQPRPSLQVLATAERLAQWRGNSAPRHQTWVPKIGFPDAAEKEESDS